VQIADQTNAMVELADAGNLEDFLQEADQLNAKQKAGILVLTRQNAEASRSGAPVEKISK